MKIKVYTQRYTPGGAEEEKLECMAAYQDNGDGELWLLKDNRDGTITKYRIKVELETKSK